MFEKQLTFDNRAAYFKNIEKVAILKPQEVDERTNDSYIYFGRVTCPYCREFVEEIPTIKETIYYVDTENTDVDADLQKVREQYGVKTVPTFILRKTDGTYEKLNRDIRQSIADFIAKNK